MTNSLVETDLSLLLESAKKANSAALVGLRSILKSETEQWVPMGDKTSRQDLEAKLGKFVFIGAAKVFGKATIVGEAFDKVEKEEKAPYEAAYARARPFIEILPDPELFVLISRSRFRGNGLVKFLNEIEKLGKKAMNSTTELPPALRKKQYKEIEPPRSTESSTAT